MTTPLLRLTVPALAAGLMLVSAFASPRSTGAAETKDGPKLAHSVFFTLKDRSASAREKFVASCHKYLSGHPGVVSFEVGTIAEDVVEPGVSVRDFDVSLLLVFDDKAAEAKYLKDPRHVKFVDENKALFEKVRVFDTYLTKKP